MSESSRTSSGAARISEITLNLLVYRSLHVVAELRIADLFSGDSLPVESLARLAKCAEEPLYRVMRACASVGVFEEVQPRIFALNDASRLLRSDASDSMRDWVVMTGMGSVWRAYGELSHTVRTGETSYPHANGEPFFSYLGAHPEEGRTFHSAMTEISRGSNASVLDAYDFSGAGCVADIGGGRGHLLTEILLGHPSQRGILFDAERVMGAARSYFDSRGIGARVECISGDFFEWAPKGADTYLLKWILHDWTDEESERILANIRRAIPASGKLLVIEMVLPSDNSGHPAKFMDIAMLSLTGGKERTLAEYRGLFERTGFRLDRVIATRGAKSILEAIPA